MTWGDCGSSCVSRLRYGNSLIKLPTELWALITIETKNHTRGTGKLNCWIRYGAENFSRENFVKSKNRERKVPEMHEFIWERKSRKFEENRSESSVHASVSCRIFTSSERTFLLFHHFTLNWSIFKQPKSGSKIVQTSVIFWE